MSKHQGLHSSAAVIGIARGVRRPPLRFNHLPNERIGNRPCARARARACARARASPHAPPRPHARARPRTLGLAPQNETRFSSNILFRQPNGQKSDITRTSTSIQERRAFFGCDMNTFWAENRVNCEFYDP
jgi:hypothetical protein